MPLKLNVGLSKKIGQPDFGSLGASCSVEVELDANLLQTDLDGFHDRVSRAFAACRQAVTDELARHAGSEGSASNNGRQPTNGDGTMPSGNGNGHSPAGASSQRASASQNEYIQQLASQIRGIGVRRLDQLCQRMYSKPLADLSGMDASGLIDTLRAIKAGEIDVNQALGGAVV